MSPPDEPITLPPPPGEEDAYSAATKVATVPDDLLDKLRAEGLLPPEAPAPGAAPLAGGAPAHDAERVEKPRFWRAWGGPIVLMVAVVGFAVAVIALAYARYG